MTDRTVDFLLRLERFLAGRSAVRLDEPGASRAAVAIVVTREPDASILLVKRKERAGDPWSGHAAFPGGYSEQADDSPEATAERETLEETGLELARLGHRLGRLDDVYPRSVFLPRIVVTPVVFSVAERLAVRPMEEIERAVWVRASELFDPANRAPFVLDLPAGKREFPSIRVAGLTVWGLTERILDQIVSIYQQ